MAQVNAVDISYKAPRGRESDWFWCTGPGARRDLIWSCRARPTPLRMLVYDGRGQTQGERLDWRVVQWRIGADSMNACVRGQHSRRSVSRSFRRNGAAISFVSGLTMLLAVCSSSATPGPEALPSGPSTVVSASGLPNGVVASISVSDGAGATSLAVVDDSLWVVDYESQKAARIDPESNSVVQTVDIGRGSCGLPLGAFSHF